MLSQNHRKIFEFSQEKVAKGQLEIKKTNPKVGLLLALRMKLNIIILNLVY